MGLERGRGRSSTDRRFVTGTSVITANRLGERIIDFHKEFSRYVFVFAQNCGINRLYKLRR